MTGPREWRHADGCLTPCKLHGDHDEERCPRCARLPRVCSHGIYHHGCPSCDRQDPEDR